MHLKWLWPVHAIHHSDPVVNGLTTYRIHILEALVMWGSYTILLTWARHARRRNRYRWRYS